MYVYPKYIHTLTETDLSILPFGVCNYLFLPVPGEGGQHIHSLQHSRQHIHTNNHIQKPHIHAHTYTPTEINPALHTHTHTHTGIQTHTRMQAHTYTTQTHAYKHTHQNTHTHINIGTYAHTQTNTQPQPYRPITTNAPLSSSPFLSLPPQYLYEAHWVKILLLLFTTATATLCNTAHGGLSHCVYIHTQTLSHDTDTHAVCLSVSLSLILSHTHIYTYAQTNA